MNEKAITIVLPVYGRSELLEPALSSVLAQTSPNWRLLIADDGSDAVTQGFVERWLARHPDPRISWVRRPQNLGLFANLNKAIEEAVTGWVLLLCSDDLLLPSAVHELKALRQRWPEAGLILSTFESINTDESKRPTDSAWHHDQVSLETALVPPERFVPALLELGSLNGNLSGMAFSRSHWLATGPFRSDWRHAADWEWLVRASERRPLVLNRNPIAQVRTHGTQLSNSNRRSGHELQEVAEVVRSLVSHPLLANEPRRFGWAGHVMQFQLWNVLRQAARHKPGDWLRQAQAVDKGAGLGQTVLSLIKWLPERWRRRRGRN